MILDTLSNSERFLGIHPGLTAAFSWATERAPSAKEGTHQVASRVRAGIQEYITAPAELKKWESHRRNIDLQIVLSGSETVGWSPVSELISKVAYDEGTDAEFYYAPAATESPAATFRLAEGYFAIFFPEDGHQPGVQDHTPAAVRKLVFKLAI